MPTHFGPVPLVGGATNFYLHNFGDYARDTGHLSILEHGAYRKLLDYLYATEKPLPLEKNKILRLIGCRTTQERDVVLKILEEFFTKTQRGWTHKRYLEELKRVNAMRYRNRENGKKGGRPPKNQETQSQPTGLFKKPTGNPLETQNNQTLDSKTLDSRLQTPETPLPSVKELESARLVALTVAEEEGRNGNGKHPAPTSATVKAFRALGHKPFGSHKFQCVWLEQYSKAGEDPNWTDIMEMTIQVCQDNHIQIPGLFYKHKHEIENGEVRMRYKV